MLSALGTCPQDKFNVNTFYLLVYSVLRRLHLICIFEEYNLHTVSNII